MKTVTPDDMLSGLRGATMEEAIRHVIRLARTLHLSSVPDDVFVEALMRHLKGSLHVLLSPGSYIG